MSYDTMLVVAAVIAMFVTFAGVLIWGDYQTRPERGNNDGFQKLAKH